MADDGKEFSAQWREGMDMVMQVDETLAPTFFDSARDSVPPNTIADSINVTTKGGAVSSGVNLYCIKEEQSRGRDMGYATPLGCVHDCLLQVEDVLCYLHS
jgi:hypothetical protein